MFWFRRGKHFEKRLNVLDESVKNSFENIKKDIQNVGNWINFLHDKHKNHDDRLNELVSRLEHLETLLKDEFIENKKIYRRSNVHERVQSFKRSNQSFMNVQGVKKLGERLTPAEKRVIQLLYLAKRPLSYEEIAKELRLNIVTIRRHINDIKKVGFSIEEKIDVGNRRKVFYIKREIKKVISSKK